MFDFGLSASHILVIVVLAVIAIGPKDLPVVLRRFGQFMNRMRGMARDFQGQVDAAMKDAGMDGIRQDLQTLKTGVTAAMSPTTALMSGVTNSALSATPDVATETSTFIGSSPAMSSLLDNSRGDFFQIFGADTVGETRVQGRGLDDEGRA